MSSKEDDTGSSVVILKYRLRHKIDWWKQGGMLSVKKEVEPDNIDKGTIDMKEKVEKHNSTPHEVKKEHQESTEEDDQSSKTDNTEEESADQKTCMEN